MQFADLSLRNFETKSVSDDKATFTGVASTSDEDLHADIIEPGAFGKSLNNIVLLREHNPTQVIGMLNEFVQDGKSLRVSGEIGFDTDKARETYALMKRGYLSGLSPGFVIQRGGTTYDKKLGVRRITKAMMVECSVVAMPANPQARLQAKSVLEKVGPRDFLFDLGFEEDDIEVLVTKGFDALLRGERQAPPPGPPAATSPSFLASPPLGSEMPAWASGVRALLTDIRNRHHDC